MDLPVLDPHTIMTGLLIFLRVGLIIILLPVLGHTFIPVQAKAGLAVLVSMVLYPVVAPTVPAIPLAPVALAIAAVKEILIAGMIALFAQLAFTAVQLAGQTMSYQMGLAVANIFDPTTSSQEAIVAQFATTTAMLVWLAVGAHHLFLLALANSFHLLPIGVPWTFHGWAALSNAVAAMFVTGLRLMAPVLLLLLFVYVALGLLSRAVPQIQVFFVSAPLTVALGLLVFALSMPAFVMVVRQSFADMGDLLPGFLHAMAGH